MTETLHPEESITSFLLIRHGHTKQTEEGKLYTDPTVELTAQGIAQAKSLAAWLSKRKPDHVLSSTAKRVVSTAELVSSALNMVPVPIEGLDEWSVGAWEGRSYLDIKKNDPDLYTRWSADPIRNAPPEGESIADLCVRIDSKLDEMIEKYDGQKLALITHSGVIRAILVRALAMPLDNFWRISIPVGSVTRVDFSPNFATVHYTALRPASSDGLDAPN